MSSQLYPEVKSAGSLGAVFSTPINLPIGVEGWKDDAGTAVVGAPVTITRPADADTQFGAASTLAKLVKFLLRRGVPSVTAVASVSGAVAPTLVQRKAAWTVLEQNPFVRLRLTDSVTQADLVALADSAEWAEGIQNRQTAIVGLASGTAKASVLTAAGAIASKRGVLVAPGILDENGVLQTGAYAAAWVAAVVAQNPDLSDDLDTFLLAGSTGIEKAASGMPLFGKAAGAGTPVNDFEDLLQGGASPLEQDWQSGQAKLTHLRTTYTTDGTFDALQTRLVVDHVFLSVRDYCLANNYLRKGNTQKNRDDLAAGVEQLLSDMRNLVTPKIQPDGNEGYGVTVIPSSDLRSATIHFTGEVVRGFSTLLVDDELTIAA